MGSSRTQRSRSQRRSSLNEKAVCLIHRLFSDPCGSAAGARSAAGDHFYRNHPSGGWRGARNHPDTTRSPRGPTNENGTKTVSKKNASGQVVWSASLKGTFTYDGKKATCTASSVSVSIKNSTWKLSSKSAGKTGNKATGKVVMKQYYQNSVIDSVTQSITLSCSPSGALS